MTILRINNLQPQSVQLKMNRNTTHPSFKTSEQKTDTIELTKTKEKKNNTPLVITCLALATVAGILGLRAYKNQYINKAQKTFQEVFMRDNITKEETISILRRYKELNKIKDKEEYAKAVFQEVKQNFGFKDRQIELVFKELSESKASGGCSPYNDYIEIDIKKSRKDSLLSLIHHEFRHAKQHEFVYNEFPERAREKFMNKLLRPKEEYINKLNEIIHNKIPYNKAYEYPEVARYYSECLSKYGLDIADKKTKQKFKNKIDDLIQKHIGELSPQNVPEKYKEFAQKCRDNQQNYINIDKDYDAYIKQFVEVDANDAATKIIKLLSGIIPV